MEENLKGRLVLVLGILNVIFLLLWAASCNDARNFKSARIKEMDTRLEAEQKSDVLVKEKSGLEEKNKRIQQELAEEKLTLESIKKSLTQEQLISNSLKAELEKISKLKEALEEDLKEALVKSKFSMPEKPKK
ncbi:MAG: hypothetical protein V1919_03170 [Candidatus Omnitrophota bacterium]